MIPKLSEIPNTIQYKILVELRPGGGQAKFFADVEFQFSDGRRHWIYDFPVWNGKDGVLRPDLPTKPNPKNPSKRFLDAEFDAVTWAEVKQKIKVACETHQEGEKGK